MVIQVLQTALASCAVANTIYAGTVAAMAEAGCVEAYELQRGGDDVVPHAALVRFLLRPSDGMDTLIDETAIERRPYFMWTGGDRIWQLFAREEGLAHTLGLRLHQRTRVLAVLKRRLRGDGEIIPPERRQRVRLHEGDLNVMFPSQYLGPHPEGFLPTTDFVPSFQGMSLRRLEPHGVSSLVSGREFVIPARP